MHLNKESYPLSKHKWERHYGNGDMGVGHNELLVEPLEETLRQKNINFEAVSFMYKHMYLARHAW